MPQAELYVCLPAVYVVCLRCTLKSVCLNISSKSFDCAAVQSIYPTFLSMWHTRGKHWPCWFTETYVDCLSHTLDLPHVAAFSFAFFFSLTLWIFFLITQVATLRIFYSRLSSLNLPSWRVLKTRLLSLDLSFETGSSTALWTHWQGCSTPLIVVMV